MKKTVVTLVLSALLLAGVACGGSSSSAKDLYASYVKHYGYVAASLGADPSDLTFEDFVSDLDAEDCEPLDGETLAVAGLFVGETLKDHGDDVAGFAKATNELNAALKAEGYCK